MSKFGKILGLVVALLAITAAVCAFFIARQVKQARYRAQILATNLSNTASVLDSGSGIAEKANFRKAGDDNKESGSLGWPSAQAAGDLSAPSNSYDTTAGQVVELAGDVIKQRNAVIDKLVVLSDTLECPSAAKPKSDIMQDLNSYTKKEDDPDVMETDSVNAFETHVSNRVKRDKNIKNALNGLLRQLGVNRSFNSDITNGGALSSNDQGALTEAGTRFSSLNANFKTVQNFLKDVATELQGARVNGVSWAAGTYDRAYTLSGLEPNTAAALSEVIGKLKADMKTTKTQLQTIDTLKGEIERLKKELLEARAEVKAKEERLREVGKLVETVYAGGAMEYGRKAGTEPLASFADVKKDLCGRIVRLDTQFGYVVTDLHNGLIVKNAKLAVFRGGKFLGIIKILQADDFNSLAIVVSGRASDMAVGDTLILAESALQDRELIGQ